MKKQSKGFTLIELLVVISIIGLLSSVVMASLNTARSKARDSKRIQDMRQIQLALELYKSNTGSYPSSGGTRENSCWAVTSVSHPATYTSVPGGGWSSALSSLVSSNLISALPNDPKNTGTVATYPYSCYSYTSSPVGTYASCVDIVTGTYVSTDVYEYALYINLENTPSTGNVIHWHTIADSNHSDGAANFSSKPYNYCILGPKK